MQVVILDFVLIQGLKIGVAGAAVATDISQLVSGVACLIYMNKRYEVLKLSAKDRRAGKRYMINLCMNGIPMGLQYSITAIGSVILQTAVNTLGATYVAAMTAGSKIFTFTCCPFDALGSTMATYGGQNVGGPDRDGPERDGKKHGQMRVERGIGLYRRMDGEVHSHWNQQTENPLELNGAEHILSPLSDGGNSVSSSDTILHYAHLEKKILSICYNCE